MITYWLWFGSEVVTSVRAQAGLDDWTVRNLALASHEHIPLCRPQEAPFEKSWRISCATVRIY